MAYDGGLPLWQSRGHTDLSHKEEEKKKVIIFSNLTRTEGCLIVSNITNLHMPALALAAMSLQRPLTDTAAASKTFAPLHRGSSWSSCMESYLAAAFGQEGLRQLSKALCWPPCSTCLRLNTLHHSREVLIASAHCPHNAELLQLPAVRYHVGTHSPSHTRVVI